MAEEMINDVIYPLHRKKAFGFHGYNLKKHDSVKDTPH